jgi:hypothetical protein
MLIDRPGAGCRHTLRKPPTMRPAVALRSNPRASGVTTTALRRLGWNHRQRRELDAGNRLRRPCWYSRRRARRWIQVCRAGVRR